MPSVATIISKARRFANINTNDYPDVTAVSDLNDGKNDYWSSIISSVNEDYGWQTWTSDTVNLQSEYTLPNETSSYAGAKKIETVSVNYDGSTYPNTGELVFWKADQVDPSNLEKTWEYYKQYQDPKQPIYYISDKSLFIAPVPGTSTNVAAGTGRLRMTGLRKIPDWTISTTEDDIALYIPIDQQQALIYWLCWQIDLTKRQPQEAQQDKAAYDQMKADYIVKLSDRVVAPFYSDFPDDRAAATNYSPMPTTI